MIAKGSITLTESIAELKKTAEHAKDAVEDKEN